MDIELPNQTVSYFTLQFLLLDKDAFPISLSPMDSPTCHTRSLSVAK